MQFHVSGRHKFLWYCDKVMHSSNVSRWRSPYIHVIGNLPVVVVMCYLMLHQMKFEIVLDERFAVPMDSKDGQPIACNLLHARNQLNQHVCKSKCRRCLKLTIKIT